MLLTKALRCANDVMTSFYAPKWSPLQVFFFQINLLSNLNILRLVLGDWSWSGDIKQDFLMITPICCFTKKVVNTWAYISETPPNQPDYPWFSKCPLNLGLEKHMLINSADVTTTPLQPLWRLKTRINWHAAVLKVQSIYRESDKCSLTCFESILKISLSNYLWFCSNLTMKFAIFLKSSLYFKSFYCLFCL